MSNQFQTAQQSRITETKISETCAENYSTPFLSSNSYSYLTTADISLTYSSNIVNNTTPILSSFSSKLLTSNHAKTGSSKLSSTTYTLFQLSVPIPIDPQMKVFCGDESSPDNLQYSRYNDSSNLVNCSQIEDGCACHDESRVYVIVYDGTCQFMRNYPYVTSLLSEYGACYNETEDVHNAF
ncbi:hypothetical protein SNEBB_003014 [Seison nebaliae]|nr:hypothetical protein SNEBB_003014 [Seison nebaliae]